MSLAIRGDRVVCKTELYAAAPPPLPPGICTMLVGKQYRGCLIAGASTVHLLTESTSFGVMANLSTSCIAQRSRIMSVKPRTRVSTLHMSPITMK